MKLSLKATDYCNNNDYAHLHYLSMPISSSYVNHIAVYFTLGIRIHDINWDINDIIEDQEEHLHAGNDKELFKMHLCNTCKYKIGFK